jgi:hypothetical protein
MPRTIAEENWVFDFVEEEEGSCKLTVTCGTVAVHDVRVVLTARER